MDESTQTKVCSRCEQGKPLGDFNKRPRSKDGLTVWCKPCMSEYSREHYDQNREKRAEQRREWYEANKEERRAQIRAYRLAHLEEESAARRVWNAANPEWRRRLTAEWPAANPERSRELSRLWREANLERERARKRRRYAEDPERFVEEAHRRRALIRGVTVGPIDYDVLWIGVCGICLTEIDRALVHPDPMSKSVDHIMPIVLGGEHVQSNLQYAHLRCNVSKGAKVI